MPGCRVLGAHRPECHLIGGETALREQVEALGQQLGAACFEGADLSAQGDPLVEQLALASEGILYRLEQIFETSNAFPKLSQAADQTSVGSLGSSGHRMFAPATSCFFRYPAM